MHHLHLAGAAAVPAGRARREAGGIQTLNRTNEQREADTVTQPPLALRPPPIPSHTIHLGQLLFSRLPDALLWRHTLLLHP